VIFSNCYDNQVAPVCFCRVIRAVPVALALWFGTTPRSFASSSEWFARPWHAEDGLPNNTIFGLAQTPDGYLWLGTRTGLARFDGVRFEEFNSTNFVARPNRGIITMLNGRDGALWLAMDRGAVVRLNGGLTKSYVKELPSSIPGSLAEDGDGRFWISYRGGAVYSLKGDQVVSCTARQGLPGGSDSCALAADINGRIWFAKAGEAGLIENGVFRTLCRYERLPAQLATARSGGVWLCAGTALSKIEPNGHKQELGAFESQRANTVVNVLLEDHEGAVWLGTSYSGLLRHDAAGFEAIETTHQQIQSLAEDREGNLWVGTFGGGLNRVRRRAVTLEGPENGLPFPSVMSICEDARGTIWAATQNGQLVQRTNGHWKTVPPTEGFPVEANCVAGSKDGGVWVGNAQHGLYYWRDGQFRTWGDDSQLRNQTLHTLLTSRNGDLWIGQELPPRILCLRAGQLRPFEVPSDCRVIRAMAEDAEGTIWVGTSKGNLFQIRGEELKEATTQTHGEPVSIRCLYATPDGALWLGYAGWGVGRLKEGHYAELHTEQGLYDDQISAIMADGRGWFWFSADKGLFKVRQEELEAVAGGTAARVRSHPYERAEGLPSLEGNFDDFPNVLRSRDGRLWFPTRTALAVVDPARVDEKTVAPGPVLERVLVDDKLVGWYGGVLPAMPGLTLDLKSLHPQMRLPPGYRRLDVDFSAFNFSAPATLEFRYRLDTLDDKWHEADTRRATYTPLSSGDYIFRLEARNSEGDWDAADSTLAITVLPFFWQTWTFRVAALAVFTLSIVGVVRYVGFRRLHRQLRVLEQQAALHKERARIAKDIHDDLGANLTQIALMGELAQQDRSEPEKASERMGKISTTARQALKALEEIVWAVNPRNDTLGHLIDYAGQFALDYLRLAGIRCRLDFPDQTPARELSTDLRHNLFLAIKEALNNVVRHAAATEVWLRAKVTEEALEMSVEDNGHGFAAVPDDALADGLRNMRQRLADLGGECSIKSNPGSGTAVVLRLPLPRS
jgi:signal transduction histidine kinase/ligand-binding sensor domain-containing protein